MLIGKHNSTGIQDAMAAAAPSALKRTARRAVPDSDNS
jgi:hypothetical protein